MNQTIYLWLYTLFSCGCITSILLYILADHKSKDLIEMGCSCVMLIVLFMPLTRIDLSDYLTSFSEYSNKVKEEYSFDAIYDDDIYKEIIEHNYEEYILNEARAQGISVKSVEVEAIRDEESNYLPSSISYTSDEAIPDNFMHQISTQLGVPIERQNANEATRDS